MNVYLKWNSVHKCCMQCIGISVCRHCSMTTAGPSSVHVSWHHYSALCPSSKRCSQAPVVPQHSTDIVSPHCVTEVFWFWTHCALEVKLFNRLIAAGLITQPDSDAIQPPQIPWQYHFVLFYWQDHYLILICLDPLCFIKNSSNPMDGNGQSCEWSNQLSRASDLPGVAIWRTKASPLRYKESEQGKAQWPQLS